MLALSETALVPALERWWALVRAERDRLPWRSTRDPWKVLVSEVMLAQTQATRVAPVFRAFVERFPDASRCAAAPLGEVLRSWSGLGYNRRAAQLHRCALRIVEEHGGEVPKELDDLLALPGVGPYVARAVQSFAFGTSVGVLDTNIGRVLARCFVGARLTRANAQRLADQLVPSDASRDWNLALMDLGALVCTAREPSCAACPVQRCCAWRSALTTSDPAVRSAAVSTKQSRFEGSDRQGRGRLLHAACAGPISPTQIGEIAGWPGEPLRVARVTDSLIVEGLLVRDVNGALRLP